MKTVIKREAIPKTLSHPSCLEVPVLVCKPHIHTQVTETIFSECTLPMVASLLPLEEDLGGMDQEQYVDIHLKKKIEDKVQKQLTSWAVEYHISHNAFNALLKILRTELNLTYIPKDCRTLLKTETIQKMNIVTLNPGLYYHFGLKNGIIETLKRHASNFPDFTIDFSVNVDGLPVTKSSSSQFWPILGYVESIKESRPFPIGIFQGISKPQDVNEFLQPFVNEFNDLSERGMVVNNVTYSIKLTKFLCDAPAKAYVLNTKNHTGYNSCSKCHVEGDFLKNRMAFLELNSVVRNDEDVKKMLDENYHRGPSILSETNIGLVSNFPLDYMHLVCLGVTKKLLEFWTKGKQGVRLFKEDIESINNILESYRKCTVKEFSRLPRSLKELERWKATEFRQFLVYYGPSLLKPFLKDPMWSHFLSLHVAIRILISEELCRVSEYVNYAEKLLQYFVRKYGEIYGDEYINHNVHNLLHLCNDARKFGCLDNFSCFIFENYMWEIKKTLKTSKYPLQQFINRYYEFTTYCTNNSQDIDDEMLVKEVGYENIEGSSLSSDGRYIYICVKLCSGRNLNYCIQINNIEKLFKVHLENS